MDSGKLTKNSNIFESLDLEPSLSAYLQENGFETVWDFLSVYLSTLSPLLSIADLNSDGIESLEDNLLEQGKIRFFLEAFQPPEDIRVEPVRSQLRLCFHSLEPSDWQRLLMGFSADYEAKHMTGYLGIDGDASEPFQEEDETTESDTEKQLE